MLPTRKPRHAAAQRRVRRAVPRTRRADRREPGVRASAAPIADSASCPVGSSPPASGSSNSSSSRRSARPTSRKHCPPSSGPSGVSIAARSPATTSCGSPISTGRHACAAAMLAASSPSRSAAAKSVSCRTRCTSVPMRRPAGMSPNGETTAAEACSPACTGAIREPAALRARQRSLTPPARCRRGPHGFRL